MPEALRLVKAALGPDAILLDTEALGDGVVVTAAVDDDATRAAPAADELAGEVRELLGVVRALVQEARLPAAAPAASALARALGAQGVDPVIAAALVEATVARLGGAPGDGALAAALARALAPAASAPDAARVRLVFGPPGDGKTTTLVKLAARAIADGGRVLLVAADGFRLGAAAELAAYGRALGVDVVQAAGPGALARVVAAADRADAVLVDTPGAGPGQNDELGELARLAAEAGPDAARLLVVSATSGAAAAAAAWEALAPVAPTGCVLSKADAAPGAPWLSVLWHRRVPVGHLAAGRRIPGDLADATPALLARRLLAA